MKWCLKQWCLLCCAAPVKTARKWYIIGSVPLISERIQQRQLLNNSASLILPSADYSEDSVVFKCVTTTEHRVSSIIYNVTVVGKCHLLQRLSMRLRVCAKKFLQTSYFRVERDRPFSLGMSSKKRQTCQSVTSFSLALTQPSGMGVGWGWGLFKAPSFARPPPPPPKVNSIFISLTGKVLRIKGMAFPFFFH